MIGSDFQKRLCLTLRTGAVLCAGRQQVLIMVMNIITHLYAPLIRTCKVAERIGFAVTQSERRNLGVICRLGSKRVRHECVI